MHPSNVNGTKIKMWKRQTVEEEEEEEEGGGIWMEEELVEEILVRLPVKHLLRLKATCKRWRSLIESPSFIGFHRFRHRLDYQDRLLLSRPYDDDCDNIGIMMHSCALSEDNLKVIPSPLYDLEWVPRVTEFAEWPPLDIIGDNPEDNNRSRPPSCLFGPLNNGIYLQVYNDRQKRHHIPLGTSKFALCNLATREFKFLNPFPPKTRDFNLLSDLVRYPCQAAYGFGSIHNEAGIPVDYKVVVVLLCGLDSSRMLSFVYSLRRGSWEKIADVSSNAKYSCSTSTAVAGLVNDEGKVETPRYLFNVGAVICPHVFFNGSWHWLDVDFPGVKSRVHDRVLLFDVANEVFHFIQGPPHDYTLLADDDQVDMINRGLLLLNDRLSVIYIPHACNLQNQWCCVGFDVWMMMEYRIQESWTKIYSCKPAFNIDVYAAFVGLQQCTTTDGGVHIQRIFLYDGHTMQLLSWDGSQVTEHGFYMLLNMEVAWNTLGVSNYVETLDSLNLPN